MLHTKKFQLRLVNNKNVFMKMLHRVIIYSLYAESIKLGGIALDHLIIKMEYFLNSTHVN